MSVAAGYVLWSDLVDLMGTLLLVLVSLPVVLLVVAWLLGFLVGLFARWVERRLDGPSAAERAAAGAFPVVVGSRVPAPAEANAVPAPPSGSAGRSRLPGGTYGT